MQEPSHIEVTALTMFWVAPVAFLWQSVKAFDTTGIYNDGGTKVANDGSLYKPS